MPSTPLHRRAVLCASALATLAAAGPAAAIDPFFPTFGNDGYDVGHYDITLDATELDRLVGKAKLRITAQTSLDRFELDLAHLRVTSVAIDGKTARFSQANDKLAIRPPTPIGRGEVFIVVIDYRGDPKPLPDPTAPGDPDILPLGWLTYKNTSYALSEPVGASTFYPCNDEPTDKASFAFHVTVRKPVTAVANGILESVEDLGPTHTFNWRQRQPMTTWLATVQINPNYTLTRQTAGDIPLRYYTTPKTSPEQIDVFRETPNMIRYFESIVGPYPFDGYGSVVVDDPELYYALETQAMSTFPSDFIDVGVVAHELAHQWFGNSVTVRRWKDLWLAEGFATYLEFLYPNRNDPARFDTIMRSIYAYVDANEIGPAVVSRPQDIFADNTYYRGALVLYALRLKVGEMTFNRVLRAWYLRYRDKNATSKDFVDVAVETSRDSSVRPLMEDWIFRKAVPPLGDPEASAGASAQLDMSVIDTHKARRHRAWPLAGQPAKGAAALSNVR